MPLNPNIRKIDSNVFAGLVDQGNPYAGQAWADAFGAIAEGVQDITQAQVAKQQRDKEEQERERLLSLEEYKEAKDTFSIEENEGDTAAIRNAKVDAGNDLANEAADLSRMYRKGEITLDEYKEREGALQAALAGVNNGDAFLQATTLDFNQMVQNPGSVSKASSNEALAVAKGISNGSVTMTWNKDTNRLEYTGTYVDAEGNEQPIQGIEVGKENSFPRLVGKAEDPNKALLTNLIQADKLFQQASVKDGIEYTGMNWEDPRVQQSFDTVISGMVTDNNQALSIATDYLNIPREQAYALMAEGAEGGGNKLQELVKNELTNQAANLVSGSRQKTRLDPTFQRDQAEAREQRAQERHEQQMAAIETGGQGGLTPNKAYDVTAEQAQKAETAAIIQTALTPNKEGELSNLAGIIGKGNITGAEYDSNWLGGGGTVKIQVKGIDEPIEFETDANGQLPDKALQFIFNQTGLGQVQQDNPLDLNL